MKHNLYFSFKNSELLSEMYVLNRKPKSLTYEKQFENHILYHKLLYNTRSQYEIPYNLSYHSSLLVKIDFSIMGPPGH